MASTLAQRIRADLYGGQLGLTVFGIASIAVFCTILLYQSFYHSPPSEADLWAAVMDAHPDAGMECHTAVVERILDTTGMLYGGPYAVDDSGRRLAEAEIKKAATGMVLDGDWHPPECGDQG